MEAETSERIRIKMWPWVLRFCLLSPREVGTDKQAWLELLGVYFLMEDEKAERQLGVK